MNISVFLIKIPYLQTATMHRLILVLKFIPHLVVRNFFAINNPLIGISITKQLFGYNLHSEVTKVDCRIANIYQRKYNQTGISITKQLDRLNFHSPHITNYGSRALRDISKVSNHLMLRNIFVSRMDKRYVQNSCRKKVKSSTLGSSS